MRSASAVRLDHILRLADVLTRSDDVIHMKSQDAVHRVVDAVHVEDATGVVILDGHSGAQVDAAVQRVLEELDCLGDGFVSGVVPLFGRLHIAEGRLGHLHHLVLLQPEHLL